MCVSLVPAVVGDAHWLFLPLALWFSCELGHGVTWKHLSKGEGFFFAGLQTRFPSSIPEFYACDYKTIMKARVGMQQRMLMKKSNLMSSL